MDENSLFWLLSTLPQVSAALVALIGFLALQRLDQLSRRKSQLEVQATDLVVTRHPRKPPFDQLGTLRIQGMTGSEFMTTLRQASRDTPEYQSFSWYCDKWEPLDTSGKAVRNRLRSFALRNLVVICAALTILPLVPAIGWLGKFAIFVTGGVAIVAALYIAWEAFKMIRESISEADT
jgi:hypothetical protein